MANSKLKNTQSNDLFKMGPILTPAGFSNTHIRLLLKQLSKSQRHDMELWPFSLRVNSISFAYIFFK